MNALVDDATGQVLGIGFCEFEARAGATQVAVNGPLPEGVPIRHLRVVNGLFQRATASQRNAADAEQARERQAAASGALAVRLVLPDVASLRPPPRAGLLVVVQDNGSGQPALAISVNNNRWALFNVDSSVVPT